MQAIEPVLVAAHPMEVEGVTGAEVIGVGLVESALGIARVLEQKPRGVVLVGSCGAYGGIPILEIVIGRSYVLASASGELGPVPARASPPALEWIRAREVTVASTLAITTTDEDARALAALADVENLEAFAVARACERAGVPFACVLGVTNPVGARGREAWRENARAVAAKVIAAIRNPTRSRSPA